MPDTESADRRPRRIAVTGSSGLIGWRLCARLRETGDRVDRIVRTKPSAGSTDIAWAPDRGPIDGEALEGCDAIVHLAGESIAGGRWTAARKERIRTSRVDGTRLLCEALAKLEHRPEVLVSASAIGFYGNRPGETVTEESKAGAGYLPDVCAAWEGATKPAEQAGIRVAHLRTGIVLAKDGGALAKMLTPFRLGFGGVVGNGRQMMSWISLEDQVRAIEHILATPDVRGPVNAVAPDPVTNREFTKTLGRVLRRPTIAPLPAPVVKLIFGEMGKSLLLEGCRVQPTRLLESGFEFQHPDLESALRHELA